MNKELYRRAWDEIYLVAAQMAGMMRAMERSELTPDYAKPLLRELLNEYDAAKKLENAALHEEAA